MIANLIRGLSPYPAAFSTLKTEDSVQDVKIFSARAEWATHSDAPGNIVTDNKKTMKVACKNGYVHILEIQAPGKKDWKHLLFWRDLEIPAKQLFL